MFLRRLAKSDADEYLGVLRESWPFHRRWSPRPPEGAKEPYPREAFDRALAGARKANHERLLVCRLTDGAIVGSFSINEIVRGSFQSAFLGYWVGSAHRRKGYMTEGFGLLLDHAFGAVALHRVEANIRPENAASLALVRRLGFRFEGLARRYLKIDGDWRDHEHWTMLAEDWAKLRGSAARRRKA